MPEGGVPVYETDLGAHGLGLAEKVGVGSAVPGQMTEMFTELRSTLLP